MKLKHFLLTIAFALVCKQTICQKPDSDSSYRKFFVDSAFFALGNFLPNAINPYIG